MRLKLIISMVLLCQFSWSQSQWQDASLDDFKAAIMAVENKTAPNTSYSFETHYNLYSELTDVKPEMELEALLICSNGKEIFINQFGRIIVQNELLNVTCDTSARMIVLNDPNPELFKKKATSDFSVLKETNCRVQKKSTSTETAYSLKFPEGFSYLGAEIWINKASGQASKYILYSSQEIAVEKDGLEKMTQPRMEAIFKNYLVGKNVQLSKMKKISDYVLIQSDGNFVLNSNYSDYELIDIRTTNEN